MTLPMLVYWPAVTMRLALIGPDLAQVEQAVTVDVAAGERGTEVIARDARCAVVVHDRHIRQRDVAGVRHLVGEGGRAADGQDGAGRRISILAVDQLLDVDGGSSAKMVGRVGVGHRLADRGLTSDLADVGVLAGGHDAVGAIGPDLAQVEQAVTVDVAAGERGTEVIARDARCAVVVHDRHVRQRDVAGVRHLVGEGGRAADGQDGAGRRISILAVDQLLDVDGGSSAKMVGRVGVGHRLADRGLTSDLADVGVLAGGHDAVGGDRSRSRPSRAGCYC